MLLANNVTLQMHVRITTRLQLCKFENNCIHFPILPHFFIAISLPFIIRDYLFMYLFIYLLNVIFIDCIVRPFPAQLKSFYSPNSSY